MRPTTRAFALTLGLVLQAQTAFAQTAPEQAATDDRPLAGHVEDNVLYSGELQRWLPYRVYLPPEYARSGAAYPTLYMLHGAGGDYMEWSYSGLIASADALIQLGVIGPLIIVMPEGGGRSYWANWADGGPRWADYLTRDVVASIDRSYRTLPEPANRAIGGLSMGGLGALNIALHHPDLFGVVGAHSPSVRLEPDPELWFLPGADFYDNDPVYLVEHGLPNKGTLAIWVDVGTDDWWRPNVERLRGALEGAGLAFTWHEFAGTHEAEYWIAHVPDYLAFYSSHLPGTNS